MNRTIAYIRVSTDKQVEHGVSLEAQQAKLEAYAKLYDLEIVETITDAGVSAKTLERPGLQRALGLLRSGKADALLVVKLDRLTRSVADLGCLIDDYFTPNGAALMSVSEQIDTRTAAGRLILNILGSVSQWERETISERTRDAMQHKKEQGEYTGGHAPYGFQNQDGELKEDAVEQQVLQHARTLRAAGLSLRKIAIELGKRGFTTRKGKAFLPAQISRMVANG
ncbi:Site-specific DNA recombinase [Allochromatium warmingii]|uniref:Site-specific DNA recombinase n=1 Tax=Allochromatium warmingii TaxID=61595 RepID=A0A1H3JTI2_ALLWA|nr:recombinase family protein [Allochromatium warmingii]SDY42835.1 Site-specific DNA recombinase [Allochromatium warmingii]